MNSISSYFTVAHTYIRTRKWEFCSDACTFASKLFGNEYLTKAQERVKVRMSQLK
jgi:hypothetical protein